MTPTVISIVYRALKTETGDDSPISDHEIHQRRLERLARESDKDH